MFNVNFVTCKVVTKQNAFSKTWCFETSKLRNC